ncbi:MAG: queuosine precursor transporter [Bacteroidetes bacterium]|nr:queuosine precursor transporter [Bacteroidota bacterium]MDA0903432.1 queuosine precursor transporter [Bacteroidota bacterium]MDA1241536.1 queuosine precursor transporter [Bacteroidota bacterium]
MSVHSVLPPLQLQGRERDRALGLFLGLAGMFVASLVTCNLIFRKFFEWDLGGVTFEQSVGLLPYPITFLVTDLISEIYGKKKANQVVVAGLVASVMTLGIIALAGHASATSWSPVTDGEFDHVFGQTALAVGASMAAYLLAQSLDVQLFHHWKRLTQGRHLWLRNNLSTIPSQIIDTLTVLVLLCAVGEIGWNRFGDLLLNGVLFKACVAALDTPLVYLGVGVMRKQFGLKPAQEIAL